MEILVHISAVLMYFTTHFSELCTQIFILHWYFRENFAALNVYFDALTYHHVYEVGTYDVSSLRWRRNGQCGVSNHQPHHCLLNRLFGCRSKKTSKLRITGLCAGNSAVTGEFPAQMASNVENVSIWWRHHIIDKQYTLSVSQGIFFQGSSYSANNIFWTSIFSLLCSPLPYVRSITIYR